MLSPYSRACRARLWSALLLLSALLFPMLAGAAVPHEEAVPAYAEEQTILQQEKDVPEPGFGSSASGRNHFDRHFIIPPGFMPEQDVILQRGGNIDPLLLLRVIEHGLAAAGRFLRFRVRCGDQPGQLARLLGLIAEHMGNVVDVEHSRQNPRLRLGEVEVALSVETRGPEHSEKLVATLRADGYPVTFL